MGNHETSLFVVRKQVVMSGDKSLATRIRQCSHSFKQNMYYALGIKKRGYSRKFIRERGYALTGKKPGWMLFKSRARVTGIAAYHMFFPHRTRVLTPEGHLYARVFRADGNVEDLGLISTKVITDAFVHYIVDQLQSSAGGIAGFRFHAAGIGSAIENQTDTTLASEVATRALGTQAEGASANIYKSVGTVNFGGSFAIVEHGLFRASSGDILADRSVFASINVATSDSIEFTYELTLPAGN